jgi:UDP-N-acetylglucosamine acyltransferase
MSVATEVHSTAIVDPKARLGAGVQVGPYAVIGPDTVIGEGTVIHNHATVTGHTSIGANCQIHPGAVVGGAPQDLKYQGEKTTLSIGDHTVIRECCTLHTGTGLGGGKTVVGSHNLIMAYVHIAHDCILGNQIVIANATQLAGHVHVEDGARISGLAAIHHFVRIGRGSFVAGCAKLSIDVPPYTLAEGHPARIRSLNLEGLRRRTINPEALSALKESFRLLFRFEEGTRAQAFEQIAAGGLEKHPIVAEFVGFVRETDKGRHGRAQEATRVELPPEERNGKLGVANRTQDEEDSDE